MTLNETLLTIGLITLIVYAVFNILYLIDLRKTSVALRQFIAKTDENLNTALAELRSTLGDLRRVAADIAIVVERVRSAASAVTSVEKSLAYIYGYYRDGLRQSAQANLAGLKAGLKAGVISLVKNFKEKKRA
jgi:hypothetical protein